MNEIRRIELSDDMSAVLEDIAAGHEVVFTHHGHDVAKLELLPRADELVEQSTDKIGTAEAFRRFAEIGRKIMANANPPITFDEAMAWRREGLD